MTGPALLRAIQLATADLEASAREVDALNVFPVPDGDTGSNMLATMRAAVAAGTAVPVSDRSLPAIAAALAAGGLAGARGNSGVILSQILRGLAAGLDSTVRADGALLAAALNHSAELARQAVAHPVEGTMLTVIDEASRASQRAARRSRDVGSVLRAAVSAAGAAVRATPGQLLVLRDAGVVDSGAVGLFVLLRGVLRGPLDGMAGIAEWSAEPTLLPVPLDEDQGHEVMFVLHARIDERLDLAALRAELTDTADSVIVAGDAVDRDRARPRPRRRGHAALGGRRGTARAHPCRAAGGSCRAGGRWSRPSRRWGRGGHPGHRRRRRAAAGAVRASARAASMSPEPPAR